MKGFRLADYPGEIHVDGIGKALELMEAEAGLAIIGIAPAVNLAKLASRRPEQLAVPPDSERHRVGYSRRRMPHSPPEKIKLRFFFGTALDIRGGIDHNKIRMYLKTMQFIREKMQSVFFISFYCIGKEFKYE